MRAGRRIESLDEHVDAEAAQRPKRSPRPMLFAARALLLLFIALLVFLVGRSPAPYAMEINARISEGGSIQVFADGSGTAPLTEPILPGVRADYRFEGVPREIQRLRIDPTDIAGARVTIYKIKFLRGTEVLREIRRFDDTEWAFSGLDRIECRRRACEFVASGADPVLAFRHVPLVLARSTWASINHVLVSFGIAGFGVAALILGFLAAVFRCGIGAPRVGSAASRSSFIVLVIGVLCGIGSAAYLASLGSPDPAPFMPEIYGAEAFYSAPQGAAHKAVLGVLVLALGALYFLPKPVAGRTADFVFGFFRTGVRARVVLLIPLMVIAAGVLVAVYGREGVKASQTDLFLGGVLLGGLSVVCGGVCTCRRNIGGSRLALVLVLCALVVSAGYGVWLYPSTLRLGYHELTFKEGHYTLMPGAAGRIAAGFAPVADVKMWYGLMFPALFAAIERTWGALDFGGYFRVLQVLNGLFLLSAISALSGFYLRLRRGRVTELVLALLLIAPYLVPLAYAGLEYPNVTAWRHMNFALGAALLVALARGGREPRFLAGWIGVFSGVLLLINLETGVSVTAGLLVYLAAVRRRSIGQLCLEGGIFVLGVGVSFGVFYLGFQYEFGTLTPALFLRYFLPQSNGLGTGIAGRLWVVAPFTILALAIFFHAAITLFFGFMLQRNGTTLSAAGRVKMSVAAIIVVWFAYFANRPENVWLLWTYLFLFCFLLEDHLRALRRVCAMFGRGSAGQSPRRFDFVALPLVGVLLFLLMPALVRSNRVMLELVGQNSAVAGTASFCPIGGILLECSGSALLRRKVDMVKELSRDHSVVYLGTNTFLLPQLSGVYPKLNVQDPYVETMRKGDYEEMIRRIQSLGPEYVLVEPKGFRGYFSAALSSLFDRIRKDIESTREYELTEENEAWSIYRRRGAN